MISSCIVDNYSSNPNLLNKKDDNNFSYLDKNNILKYILFDELSIEQLQEFILTYSSNESSDIKSINYGKFKPILNKVPSIENKNPAKEIISKLENDYINSSTVEMLNNNYFEQDLNLINKKNICEILANDLKFIISKKLKEKINEKINEHKSLTQIKSEVFLLTEKARVINGINQKKISDLEEKIFDSTADVRLLSQLINDFNTNFSSDDKNNENDLELFKANTFLDKSNLIMDDLTEEIKNYNGQENNLLVSGVYCNLAESKYFDNSLNQSDMSFVSLNTFSNYFNSKFDFPKKDDKDVKIKLNSDKNIQIKPSTTLEQCFDFLFYKEPLIGKLIGVEKAFLNKDTSINLVAYLAHLEDLILISKRAYEKTGSNFLETMKITRGISKKIFQIQYLIRKRS